MRILVVLVIYIVLFEEIESVRRPTRRYSSARLPTNKSQSGISNIGCAKINQVIRSDVSIFCKKDKLYINGEETKNVKSTDVVDVISHNIFINGKFIRSILPYPNNVVADDGCPEVIKYGCYDVFNSCINGKFYINGELIKNLKPDDKVEITSNNFNINGKFIRYIPPLPHTNTPLGPVTNNGCPGIAKIGCINLSSSCENGKLYINGEWVADIEPTDRVEIISNDLKINGKRIRYFPPSQNNNIPPSWDPRNFGGKATPGKALPGNYGGVTSGKALPGISVYNSEGVFPSQMYDKLFVNDYEVKNVDSSDTVTVDGNNLYVNGKFVTYIEPNPNFF